MKKAFCFVFSLLITLSLTACAAPAGTIATETMPAPSKTDESAVVSFADPALEAMVRGAMGRPEGDIAVTEAETVTTLNLGIQEQQNYEEQKQITDISGLEYFINLETLDLSNQAIMDLSPISGLTSLRNLSLGNIPAVDYSSLKTLINLNTLLLDGSAVTDISVVSGLNQLVLLSFANTLVGDLSPLASLENLRFLYLEGCPIQDYAPINNLYPLLKEKDFVFAEYLSDLGFIYSRDICVAEYSLDNVLIQICRSDWGAPPDNYLWLLNSIQMKYDMNNDYTLITSYSPEQQTYGFTISSHGGTPAGYVYLAATNEFIFGVGDRESTEEAVRAVFNDTDSDDILLAFIPAFKDMIKNTFSRTPDALYTLPNVRPTLLNLGFVAHEEDAYCEFVKKDDTPDGKIYHSICVHRPEWGEQDYDVRFFTPINEYGLVIMYYVDEQRFRVGADNQSNGAYAVFDYYQKDDTVIDNEVSQGVTIEEFFTNVYRDFDVQDVYRYSVSLMERYIEDTFDLSADELYALPVGE